jgi:hypothetical protein
MEVKIIIIIFSLIILAGIVLSAINKKKIINLVSNNKKPCSYETSKTIKGFDKGGNQAPIQEELENVRRGENREKVHPDPNGTIRSDICSTDACQNIDPYNKQLKFICEQECNK